MRLRGGGCRVTIDIFGLLVACEHGDEAAKEVAASSPWLARGFFRRRRALQKTSAVVVVATIQMGLH
jgi:hypothetical protein